LINAILIDETLFHYPYRRFRPGSNCQFVQNVADVVVHRFQPDVQIVGDLPICFSSNDQHQNLALDRLLRTATDESLDSADDVRAALIREAQQLADEDVEINKRMAAHGAALIKDGDTILTHCNTGALAVVDYGTALGVIRMAHEQGKRIKVLADETRPRLQGARLTAWELMRWGIDVTLIADNAAGHYMRTGMINIVFVGSDRTAANGDVANKIGTYQLAVLAKENDIPFYPVVPTSTIDLSLANGDLIPIEERDEREVTEIDGVRIAPIGVKVGNPAFDVTPHRYVTGIVTENGIAYPPFEASLSKLVSRK
jgi:methylthioribose-1-phosphate isomerase